MRDKKEGSFSRSIKKASISGGVIRKKRNPFFHPDFTVGPGISPDHAFFIFEGSRAVPPVDVILVALKRNHYRGIIEK